VPRFVQPPVEELDRVFANEGERIFVRYLLDHLPEAWEVYVQPPLNGKRPDVIVLHPDIGIGVFEVKDWNLQLYRAEPDGIVGKSAQGDFRAQNPFYQAQAYRSQIFDVLAPSLSSACARDRKAFGCVELGIVFTHVGATAEGAMNLLHPYMSEDDRRFVGIVGRDTLDAGAAALKRVLRIADRTHSRYFNPAIADELRRWICEPDAEREQREPLELTDQQRELAETRTKSGFRRVKGPAGSGKSQALAARAAHLALESQDVLVCAFNITMVNYLHDIAVRYRDARAAVHRQCHFTWFHRWCRDTVVELAGEQAWYALVGQIPALGLDLVLGEVVPAEVSRLAVLHRATLHRYDAILVDEGQDWLPHWWNAMCLFLRPGGEMVLVADRTQDLYLRSKRWTEDAMIGAGFSGGRWFQLRGSHRLHPDMVPMLRDLVTRFVPEGEVPADAQLELGFGPVHLHWVNAEWGDAGTLVSAVLERLADLNGGVPIPYADTTILVSTHGEGLQLLQGLRHAIQPGHVFDHDRKVQQALKVKFWKGMGRLKACTVKSFKGWEDRAIIVVVRDFNTDEAPALLYTALSRLKRARGGACLVVVSFAPELRDFGQTWFKNVPEASLIPILDAGDDIAF
jgi:hypothetical protein